MKKKFVFLGIAALCVLLVACVAFAACDPKHPTESGFKVTLNYNSEQGDVTLSKPAEGKLYDAGEEVTVTVTPKTGWSLDSFTVSGYEGAALNDGKYTFKVTADTTVTVTFIDNAALELAALQLLGSLQGSIIFEGTRVEKDYFYDPGNPDVTINDLKTTFDAEKNAVLTESYEGSEPMIFWLFQGDKDNNIIEITHNQLGAVERTTHKFEEDEETGEKIDFSDLFNPFDLLSPSLLIKTEEHKWTIEDAAARYNIANAILGYADITMEYFEMYEENGKISKIKFAFDRVTKAGYEDYQYSYDLDIKEHGTASIDDEYFNDYPMTEAHDELKAAMESAAAETSYSVQYESEAHSFTLDFCENGVYINEKGEERGYAARPDGNIWSFYHSPADQKFEFDRPVCDDLDLLKAYFKFQDNQGEYYNLLKDMGDGSFEVRPADAFGSEGAVPVFFAQQLATGEEQIEDFSYTYTFAITIKNGKPYRVNLDIEGDPVTLIFGGWGTTTMPVQIPDDALNGSIDGAYSGNWASENGETVLNIDLDKLLFAGKKVENLAALNNDGYSFTYDDKDYTVVKDGDTIKLTEGGTSTTLYNCPWYMYIGDFYQNDADVTIRANSIKVKFKGSNEQTATGVKFELVYLVYEDGYGDYAYQFSFKLGNVDYVMQQYGYDYDRLVIAQLNDENGLGLYRDKYEEFDSWDDRLGTYSGEGYTAKLESDKLTITFDGKSEVINELTFYRDWDYDNSNKYYYQFSFKYGSKDCVLEILNDHTLLLVIDTKGDKNQFYLTDEDYVPDYKAYYGVFDAYDDSAAYLGIRIEINENGVFIQKGNGNAEATTLLTFSEDSYGGNFTVKTADGTVYYISIWPSFGYGSLGIGEYSYGLYPVIDEAE